MIIAFEGWNDAGLVASATINYLIEVWQAQAIGKIDPAAYYDFQVTRPQIHFDQTGTRQIIWPGTQILTATPNLSGLNITLVRGIEPSMGWEQFAAEIVTIAKENQTDLVITLGGLLAESVHTGSINLVQSAATDKTTFSLAELIHNSYQGPTGIIGVLNSVFDNSEIGWKSIWAQVPHYLPLPDFPLGTAALITELANLLGIGIDITKLENRSKDWLHRVSELIAEDPDLAELIAEIEDNLLPAQSGENIAAEFERFLREQDNS